MNQRWSHDPIRYHHRLSTDSTTDPTPMRHRLITETARHGQDCIQYYDTFLSQNPFTVPASSFDTTASSQRHYLISFDIDRQHGSPSLTSISTD